MRAGNLAEREQSRQAVDHAKHALGERGKPWWGDGAPDWNRHLVANSPYAAWFEALPTADE